MIDRTARSADVARASGSFSESISAAGIKRVPLERAEPRPWPSVVGLLTGASLRFMLERGQPDVYRPVERLVHQLRHDPRSPP
jgi:hypothetical protein